MLKEEGPYVIASRKLTIFFFIIKAVLRLRTAMVRFRVGYSRVSSFAGSGSGMISHPRFSGSGPQNLSSSVSGLAFHLRIPNG